MPCVSEGTNWGGSGWVLVTSGRFHSEVRTTVGTKRRMTTSTKRTLEPCHSGDRHDGVSLIGQGLLTRDMGTRPMWFKWAAGPLLPRSKA